MDVGDRVDLKVQGACAVAHQVVFGACHRDGDAIPFFRKEVDDRRAEQMEMLLRYHLFQLRTLAVEVDCQLEDGGGHLRQDAP
ncbi:hypothetical protein SDC9_156415 [bioreactor metagenome]|uniref:Uncharacterized protein n=1 Tax=bioreactor metagenome TaxID=1076179 RepID=A0A645F4N3_9ZZZZ